MATLVKQDFLGNYLHLNGTRIAHYHKESGKLFRITDCITRQSAKEEFKRLTTVHNRPKPVVHQQARVYYAQLIIQC